MRQSKKPIKISDSSLTLISSKCLAIKNGLAVILISKWELVLTVSG